MSLIIETDIGHDPDDFFAITYLIAAGARIPAVLVAAGDPDQIAIARLISEETNVGFFVGAGRDNRTKLSSGSIHHELLNRYGRSLYAEPDGFGVDIIEDLFNDDNNGHELFAIGPLNSVGEAIRYGATFSRATMQGGFVPYSLYRPSVTLDKFEGKQSIATFNLNGDVEGAKTFLSAPFPRCMVGKNVCHTVVFDKAQFATFAPPQCRAAELFHEAANLYFAKHDSKKFHDPIAAVCHLHPEVGTWIKGKSVRAKGEWTTIPGDDDILVDIDREKAWDYLRTMT